MTDKESQKKIQPPGPKLEDFWVMDYETRNFSEIVRDWLPWRKKKRKRS